MDVGKIEQAVRTVKDQAGFIKQLLGEGLDWPVERGVTKVEDIAYGWSKDDLQIDGLDKHFVDGQIWQIQPLDPGRKQPWGIFLLEFTKPDVFTSGRGITGPLRRILRRLVPKRRQQPDHAFWERRNLLFICTHKYEHFSVAYFKEPPEGSQTAPLAIFGWGPDIPSRTAVEFNLPALDWPDSGVSPDQWVSNWASAFDVEKVTAKFFKEYAAVFTEVEAQMPKSLAKAEDRWLYTQMLMNRLMFLRFIERKGWLKLGRNPNYLQELYATTPPKASFYKTRLRRLFFEGLALEKHTARDVIGDVPFLNGGLFEESALDKKVDDIPNAAFEFILGKANGIFYRYNFTVEESTPLDIQVAVDPEMLGKVFEELVTGRHETGSYYTPRPVVAFMCREALKGYLADKTGATAEAIAALVDKHDVAGLTETHARKVIEALDALKAVDPACGSGAYLLGLLQEMVSLYRLLYSEKLTRDSRSLYELKLRIISNNLYGVDIDPFATNIAMLRLWLSIAVDSDKPLPLPNLDFKIETGDSLMGPCETSQGRLDLQSLRQRADSLVREKEKFLTAHGPARDEARKRITQAEVEIAKDIHGLHGERCIDWRVQFAEVFAYGKGGFNIVLMNPPYVATYSRQSEKAAVTTEIGLRTQYGKYGGRINLFTCFIVRAKDLLCGSGCSVFIVPDSYATSDSYALVRTEYASRFSAHTWVLVKPPVFGANVRNVVVIAGPGEKALRAIVAASEADLGRLGVLLEEASPTIWGVEHRVTFFTSPFEQEIWARLRANRSNLSEIFDTRDGVNPGPRQVRDRILDLPAHRSRHVRPLIEGSQIDPKGYRVHGPERTILYDPAELSSKEKKAGSSLREPSVFVSPKVVSRQTADTLIAGIDPDGDYVTLNSVHCTHARSGGVELLWGLLGFLNSPLLRLFYAIDGGETRELLPQVHISWIRSIPLPPKAAAMFARLSPIAHDVWENISHARASKQGMQRIHEAVCESYGLSNKETSDVLAAYLGRYPRFRDDWV